MKASENSQQAKPEGLFPVVGIGASAGGLEALELFFSNTPTDMGVAFVIIQHLAPDHKGLMVELLQRATSMKVAQATDRMKVLPNQVYLIPPNKDLSIFQGKLHLFDPVEARGLRLPVDFFLRSLATDRLEGSIGVILSGMGSDGMLGMRAIKEKAGLCLVQEPRSAKFDGMPSSVIQAGLADIVAPVEELPLKIKAFLNNPRLNQQINLTVEAKTQTAIERIFVILRLKTGHDFSLYKHNTIYRRVERRMSLHQIKRIAEYVQFLQENPQEVELLFKELLIGVTGFFRDPAVWEALAKNGLPALLSERASSKVLRAWVPACSTGEEAYSLAIVLKESIEKFYPDPNWLIQVFATDLDQEAIGKARRGLYPANIAADVYPERLRRFFVEEQQGFRVAGEIREMVVFAPQNLILDPPFTKIDVLSCRNLLIYLEPELQKKLLPLFHYSLNPGGILLLGTAESIGGSADLFTPIDHKLRLFRRHDEGKRNKAADYPAVLLRAMPAEKQQQSQDSIPKDSIQFMVEQLLLQRITPAAVLVNNQGDIVYISGRTGKYLEPAVGKANLNIFAMTREGLGRELGSAFHKALHQKEAVLVKGIKVRTEGTDQHIDLMVQTLTSPDALKGLVIIVMTDVETPVEKKELDGRIQWSRLQPSEVEAELNRLNDELQMAQVENQNTREEMQSSQEELRSANEELQSSNEEMQSTNEEMTTSREEMQSMNEELQTINNELQAKVDQLSRAESDMNNLLNSTEIATLFLDGSLRIRRFTTAATRLIKLIPGDVGRPITDIAAELVYPELAADAGEVLRTLAFIAKEVPATGGRWFTVKIMPYRTQDNRIDGVVITFAEISAAKSPMNQPQERDR